MGGASRRHNLIVSNLVRHIGNALAERAFEVYPNDMRVKVSPTGLYTYPDVSIVSSNPQFEDSHVDTLLNPTVVIEVLSKSTQGYDRGQKWHHYRQISSLRDYVLVAQDHCGIERYSRDADGPWVLWETDELSGSLALPSVDCTIAIAEIYARVEFEPPSQEDPS